MPNHLYQQTIEACLECATACNHCAVSCLQEENVQNLAKCIRLNLECAVMCRATAEKLSLGNAFAEEVSQLCADVAKACAAECEQLSSLPQCKECAAACNAVLRETADIQSNETEEEKTNRMVHQDECATLNRATAELMSLGSSYSRQLSHLTTSACKAFADQLEDYVHKELHQTRQNASVAGLVHQEFLDHENEMKNAATEGEQPVHQDKVLHTKKKHFSALLAASMGRSALSHVRQHPFGSVMGSS
jgi:hypothetical protein